MRIYFFKNLTNTVTRYAMLDALLNI